MKNKRVIIITVVFFTIVILLMLLKIMSNIKHENEDKTIIENNCLTICNEYGLKDVSIEIDKSGYGWYDITINCSNIDDLTFKEILEISQKLEYSGEAYVRQFISNDDKYEVFSSSSSLYKNGKEIYSDYENSESHKSAQDSSVSDVSTSSIDVTDDGEKGTCWALAEEVVESQLKSPSSAKFPFSYADEDVSISKSGNTYTVKGWVEAENSFGANLKSNFTVTMTKSGSGSNAKFTAESCTIDE